ncbi:amidohydrolase [Pseudalkalibacillus decolorationis]|uniref:amidohydrolase n=1 Tax=Pseudalkalibacillus decolorationis TaxID=163879 RepID=UPI002147AD5D|nr:amidohydrolase [Pseudalkalibacillus decolorationis]
MTSKEENLSKEITSFIQERNESFVKWRRTLHQIPETGWTEFQTTFFIGKQLQSLGFTLTVGRDVLVSSERMGIPEQTVLSEHEQRAKKAGVPDEWLEKMIGGHTGLVASWDTGKKGPHIALRFDIDALPIIESTESSHLPQESDFRSKHDGSMHACAHDGHAAIGLGTAHFIEKFQNQLEGKFTLLFQPAEEGSRGAKAMVEKGWLENVDYFISGHIGIHSLEIGDIAATTSQFLATTKMNVTYDGQSAHAGVEPQKGKNALLAAAAASLHLHGISRHSSGATRINVGKLEAGNGRNIIADIGKIELETRGETTELNHYMVDEARRIIQSTAGLYDVNVDIQIVGDGLQAKCDEEWVRVVELACAESPAIKRIIPELPLGASEDVTYMMNRVQQKGGKATFLLFGTPLAKGHHHPQFDFDERVLAIAVETIGRLLFSCHNSDNL